MALVAGRESNPWNQRSEARRWGGGWNEEEVMVLFFHSYLQAFLKAVKVSYCCDIPYCFGARTISSILLSTKKNNSTWIRDGKGWVS